jgi:hypothetical protein
MENFVEYLRAVADFYEEHPEIDAPFFTTSPLTVYLPDAKAKDILRSIGSFDKTFDGDRFVAKKKIGPGEIHFRTDRENVCVAKVVGSKSIPEKVVPSSYTPEQVIPAHEEDIVEWDCAPILGENVEVGA